MAPTDSDQRLLSPQAVSFLALVALPVLAFVCAVFGLILVLQGKTLAGSASSARSSRKFSMMPL